jgi:hypothetical protein
MAGTLAQMKTNNNEDIIRLFAAYTKSPFSMPIKNDLFFAM